MNRGRNFFGLTDSSPFLLGYLSTFGRMFEGPMIAFLARGRPVPPGNRFSIVFPAQLLPAEHKHM